MADAGKQKYFVLFNELILNIGSNALRSFCEQQLQSMHQNEKQLLLDAVRKTRMYSRTMHRSFERMDLQQIDFTLLCVLAIQILQLFNRRSQKLQAIRTMREIRNTLAHCPTPSIDDDRDFLKYWKLFTTALAEIGGAELLLEADRVLKRMGYAVEKSDTHQVNLETILDTFKDVLISKERYEAILNDKDAIISQIDALKSSQRVPEEHTLGDNEDESYRKDFDVALPIKDMNMMVDCEAYVTVGLICIKHDNFVTGFSIGGGFVMSAFHNFEGYLDILVHQICISACIKVDTSIWKKLADLIGLTQEEKCEIVNEYEEQRFGETVKLWQEKRAFDLPFTEIFEAFERIGLVEFAEDFKTFLVSIWEPYIIFGCIDSVTLNDVKVRKYFHHDVAYVNKEKDIIILKLNGVMTDVGALYLKAEVDQNLEIHVVGHPKPEVQLFGAKCEILSETKLLKERKQAENWCRKKIRKNLLDYDENIINTKDGNTFFHCSKSMEHGASGSPCISFEPGLGSPVVQAMFLEGHPKFYYRRFGAQCKQSVPPCYLFQKAISTEHIYEILKDDPFVSNRPYRIGYNAKEKTYMFFQKESQRSNTVGSPIVLGNGWFKKHFLPVLLTILLVMILFDWVYHNFFQI